MVDQISRQGGRGRQNDGSSKPDSMGAQAASAGKELKDKASDIAGNSGEKLKVQASEFAEAAKDVASQATDRLKQTIADQKGAGAEYVGNLAEAIRRAAREFDNDMPIAGKYIRKAAAQVEDVSDSLRTGDFNDLIGTAQTFARRQPAAFLGLAALAGFAAVRFLKSSPGSASENGASGQRSRTNSVSNPHA